VSDELSTTTHWSRGVWLRYLIGFVVGVAILALLFGKRGEFVKALHELAHLSAPWEVGAVLVEAVSIWGFAYLQHHVLKVGGARLAMPGLFLLSLANNAIANTIPGEPAVSSAYRFRFYRRRGASGAISAWTILTILIAQAIGMSLLLLVGVVISLFGSSRSPNTGLVVVGLIVVLGAGVVLVRQDLLLQFIGVLLRSIQRITGHPRGDVATRIESTLARMKEIPVRPVATFEIVVIASSVWFLDFLCLLCSFKAVHATIPWSGVLLAYGVAQIVAALPLVPGGIGVVEGSLAVILVAYGTHRVPALAVVLAYRLLTFWVAVIVGWGSVGTIEWRSRRRREAMPTELQGLPVIDSGLS
jgi:uncharacterized protein (TIRG00374 family)